MQFATSKLHKTHSLLRIYLVLVGQMQSSPYKVKPLPQGPMHIPVSFWHDRQFVLQLPQAF